MNDNKWGYITNRAEVAAFLKSLTLRDGSEPAAYLVSTTTRSQLENNFLLEQPFKLLGRPLFDSDDFPEGEILLVSPEGWAQVRGDLQFGALPLDSIGTSEEHSSMIARYALPLR